MSGTWKRLEILKATSKDSGFVASRPMSYSIDGDTFIFGANEICDAYLWLKGHLNAAGAAGSYIALGLGGTDQIGTFTATPIDAADAPN
jgi:hypothetical protein